MADDGGESVRIVVAEDEPDVRLAFVRLLEHMGHSVVGAVGNGAELIAVCAAQEVDLAMVDLEMPVMDGLAAAEDLTERGIPVVLVSGHPDAARIVLENEPVVARILKPPTIENIRRAIDVALAARR